MKLKSTLTLAILTFGLISGMAFATEGTETTAEADARQALTQTTASIEQALLRAFEALDGLSTNPREGVPVICSNLQQAETVFIQLQQQATRVPLTPTENRFYHAAVVGSAWLGDFYCSEGRLVHPTSGAGGRIIHTLNTQLRVLIYRVRRALALMQASAEEV